MTKISQRQLLKIISKSVRNECSSCRVFYFCTLRSLLGILFHLPKRNVFTSVCDSVYNEVSCRHPPGQIPLDRHPSGQTPIWADPLWADASGQIPPLGRPPHPPDDNCSGRYASYWNAFMRPLFLIYKKVFLLKYPVCPSIEYCAVRLYTFYLKILLYISFELKNFQIIKLVIYYVRMYFYYVSRKRR